MYDMKIVNELGYFTSYEENYRLMMRSFEGLAFHIILGQIGVYPIYHSQIHAELERMVCIRLR